MHEHLRKIFIFNLKEMFVNAKHSWIITVYKVLFFKVEVSGKQTEGSFRQTQLQLLLRALPNLLNSSNSLQQDGSAYIDSTTPPEALPNLLHSSDPLQQDGSAYIDSITPPGVVSDLLHGSDPLQQDVSAYIDSTTPPGVLTDLLHSSDPLQQDGLAYIEYRLHYTSWSSSKPTP